VIRTSLVISSLALATFGGTAPASQVVHAAPVAGFSWPLQPGPDTIVSDFDPPQRPWLAGNRGVDLAGVAGEAVHASGAGIVSFAGRVAGVGVVSITSGALRTTYEPLQVTIHQGEQVLAGALIGRLSLAGSHCVPRACLHWGLLRGTDYLDPLALLGLEHVRLLPLDAL
jgi:murein DD-endopeptidase MepM/ murein hydrolase activator NlpD